MKIIYLITFLLLSTSSFGQYGKFVPGIVYDTKGRQYRGLVAFAGKSGSSQKPAYFQNASSDAILFKSDSLSLPKRINTDFVRAFTMLTDSFAILRDFKMFGLKSRVRVRVSLGRVVVGDGKVKLYNCNYRSIVRYGPAGDDYSTVNLNGYVLQKSGEEELMPVEEGINEFIPQMSAYLKDNESTVARIKSREYSFFSIEKLVRDYNALSKSSE